MATIYPRRKATTYGRTSRKTTACLSPAAADAFSRIAFAEEVRSIDNLGLTPDLTTCALKAIPRYKNRVPSPGIDGSVGDSFIPNPEPRREGQDSWSERKDTIDDISSSDEEGRQRSRVPGLAGRKRRKITMKEERNESAASAHGRVQGILPAPKKGNQEMPGSPLPRTSLTANSLRQPTKKNAIGGHHIHKSSRNVQDHSGSGTLPQKRAATKLKESSNVAVTESAKSIKAVPRTAVKAEAADRVEYGRYSSDVGTPLYKEAEAKDQRLRSPSSANAQSSSGLDLDLDHDIIPETDEIAPTTPPGRSRPPNEFTTPHQRGLWSLLLPGTTPIESPGALNLPGLKIEDTGSKLKSRDNRSTDAQKALDKPDRGARREKLVNGLQHRNAVSAIKNMHGDGETSTESECEDEEAVKMSQDLNTGPTSKSHGFPTNSAKQLAGTHISNSESYANSQPVPLNQGLGAKATYARQRSYLTEGDISDIGAFEIPILEDSAAMRRSRRAATKDAHPRLPRAQSGVRSPDETLDSQGPALRSIHELRKAGGNNRLVSEIEGMMEDICDEGSSSLSLRRSRLLELVNRLQEPSLRQVFIDHGFDCRLLTRTNDNKDVVENLFLSAAILQLLSGPTSTPLLNRINSPPIIEYLIGLLEMGENSTSVSSARAFNMSKNAHLELRAFCQNFVASSVWSTVKPTSLTARAIALQCLERLVRQTREAGFVNDVLPPHGLCRIARFLEEPLSGTTLPSLNFPTIEFQLAISILESCTIANKEGVQAGIWSGRTLNAVLGLLPMLTSRFTETPGTLRSLALRLYLNLTNNNSELCEAFSRADVLQSICDIIISHFASVAKSTASQTPELDSLILSLGSLINLAEWCEAVRNSTLELPNTDLSYLDQFVEIFSANSNKTAEVFSEEETSTNVAFGYLAVLISYLCISERVVTHVRSRLSGGTLRPLLDAVKEFLHYHRKIDEEIYHNGGDVDLKASFAARLQSIIDILERAQ